MNDTPPVILISEPIAIEPRDWLSDRAQLLEINLADRATLLQQTHAHELAASPENHIQGLIVRTYTIVDQELLDSMPHLRVVARAGVGLDNIDLQACATRNIRVVHTPKANTRAVVEFVTSMMVQTRRPIVRFTSANKDWHAIRKDAITPHSCVGSRLGIVGFGTIGSALAKVAHALGMEVVFCDLLKIDQQACQFSKQLSIEELFETSDIVSIHVDGRASNKNMINASLFNKLKPDATLINSSRGFVLNHDDAIEHALNNPSATFIFDVHDPEPIPENSRLFRIPNITLTPHIAAGTAGAKEKMSWVVRDVMRVLDGNDPEYEAAQ
ncbi:MAG: NAD(P)-dependent oxidoreductase [Phycisphaerales bacterium]|nr:NAD(P)-dependent oxidoreductase [Phycisphaerales bacterium]